MLCSSCVFCFFFLCVYLCRNVHGIVMLCAEVSLRNRVGWGRELGGGRVADSAHVRCQCGNQVDHGWWNMGECVTSVASLLREHCRTTFKIFLKRLCLIAANLEKGLPIKEPQVYNNLANIVS